MSYSDQAVAYARQGAWYGFLAQFTEVLGADVTESYQSRAQLEKGHARSRKILAKQSGEDMVALDKRIGQAVGEEIVKAREELSKAIRKKDSMMWTRELTDKIEQVDQQMRAEVAPATAGQTGFLSRIFGGGSAPKPRGRG